VPPAQTLSAEEQDQVLVFSPTKGLPASHDLTAVPEAHLYTQDNASFSVTESDQSTHVCVRASVCASVK